jgi:hypothetical protein
MEKKREFFVEIVRKRKNYENEKDWGKILGGDSRSCPRGRITL